MLVTKFQIYWFNVQPSSPIRNANYNGIYISLEGGHSKIQIKFYD
jgi:hypothetical protein